MVTRNQTPQAFDELSIALGSGMARREVLVRATGLLAGALLASLGLDRPAAALPRPSPECTEFCNDSFPIGVQ